VKVLHFVAVVFVHERSRAGTRRPVFVILREMNAYNECAKKKFLSSALSRF